MMESAVYLVTREIAERSGVIESRYRTTDNRFILNDRDLARVRFSVDEYVDGLSGVEKISSQEAKTLIAKNKYQLGVGKEEANVNELADKIEEQQENVEQTEENIKEEEK